MACMTGINIQQFRDSYKERKSFYIVEPRWLEQDKLEFRGNSVENILF